MFKFHLSYKMKRAYDKHYGGHYAEIYSRGDATELFLLYGKRAWYYEIYGYKPCITVEREYVAASGEQYFCYTGRGELAHVYHVWWNFRACNGKAYRYCKGEEKKYI